LYAGQSGPPIERRRPDAKATRRHSHNRLACIHAISETTLRGPDPSVMRARAAGDRLFDAASDLRREGILDHFALSRGACTQIGHVVHPQMGGDVSQSLSTGCEESAQQAATLTRGARGGTRPRL